jgi:hypothetical protein
MKKLYYENFSEGMLFINKQDSKNVWFLLEKKVIDDVIIFKWLTCKSIEITSKRTNQVFHYGIWEIIE